MESGPSCSVVPTTFTNGGTLASDGGTLSLSGTTTVLTAGSSFGLINGGLLRLSSTLNNEGTTPTLNAGSGALTLDGGARFLGRHAGHRSRRPDDLRAASEQPAERRVGDWNLELSQSSSTPRVSNGLSVTGEVRLSGSGARLWSEGPQTWDNATVVSSGAGSQRSITELSSGTLTLGPGFTLTGSNWFVNGAAVVNQGTLRAESGPSCSVVPTTFTNGGTIEAGGGTLTVQAVHPHQLRRRNEHAFRVVNGSSCARIDHGNSRCDDSHDRWRSVDRPGGDRLRIPRDRSAHVDQQWIELRR